MPTVIRCNGIGEFNRRLAADMRLRKTRLKTAVRRTARKGETVVRKNVPVAFAELRDSIDSDDHRIFADAPHAAAVEVGSRPHFPPIEPLIAWVKLRGTQGLNGGRGPGTTTKEHAHRVATALKMQESGGALSVDAPRRVAFAIAQAIAKRGTKPHRYMDQSVPAVVNILDEEINAALPDK